MLNQLWRYAPVLRMLRDEYGSILEVGSGVDGISQFLRRPVIGLEIRFYAPPGSWLWPVCGTATRLPFADGSVDVVLVMDTLEHVPPSLRARCIEEATRVARRRVIIGGPMGARARRSDERLAAYYRERSLPVPDWLQEHLVERAPDVSDVVGALRLSGWTVRARGNENAPIHLGIMRAETRKVWFKVFGRLRRHAPGAVTRVARALRLPPYYSYLIEAVREP
ncbi:MAG: methyltransferase domain-containing protein [Actinomycetota bacterium]